MWSQTPQFDLSLGSSGDIGIDMNVHHGIIKSLEFTNDRISKDVQEDLHNVLADQKLQDIGAWASFLQGRLKSWDSQVAALATRLDEIIPIPKLPQS